MTNFEETSSDFEQTDAVLRISQQSIKHRGEMKMFNPNTDVLVNEQRKHRLLQEARLRQLSRDSEENKKQAPSRWKRLINDLLQGERSDQSSTENAS